MNEPKPKMRRYCDLTTEEKLKLTTQELTDSVALEGLHRGLKPRITLDNLINQSGYSGFSIPADTVIFYEIIRSDKYGGPKLTGICYKTAEEARAALNNAVSIEEEGYGDNKRNVITSGDFTVQERYVTLTKQDDTAQDELADECADDLRNLRQEAYNAKVKSTKRAEYMRLANGDESIAKAFWAKTEGTEFPTE